MSYLTFNKLSVKNYRGVSTLNESWGKISSNKRIFLSYRRKDLEYVQEIVGFLIMQGINVYIDYLDELLPNPPDYTTADILRRRIQNCQKFILLATPNSNESHWMPWELGLGDGFIGYENTLILPLLNYESTWDEREYYKTYGFIKEGENNGGTKKDWAVFYPNGNKLWLNEWLNK
ncbi:MAG: toll/interleukin-1 receptor domain-containing protein [Chitinophagaceae bacterium]|nr:toll/interleukin-1 receptor domain-containing protein [Chitinophagaceae bacterium]